jgi:hypothetical protein
MRSDNLWGFGPPPRFIARTVVSLLADFRKRGCLLSANLGDRRIISDRGEVARAVVNDLEAADRFVTLIPDNGHGGKWV